MSASLTRADGCTVTDIVWYTPSLALIQKLQRKLPTPSFLTSADGCTINDSVWCAPGLALIQELERKLPAPTFPTSADGCTVFVSTTYSKTTYK